MVKRFIKLLLSGVFLCLAFTGLGQNDSVERNCIKSNVNFPQFEEVFIETEEKPRFEGGQGAFFKYLFDSISYSGESELRLYYQFNFVIDTCGYIQTVFVPNKEKSDYNEVEKYIYRRLKNSPKWIPGLCNEKPVNYLFDLPIRF